MTPTISDPSVLLDKGGGVAAKDWRDDMDGFDANRMVLQTMSQFFPQSELEGLGDVLVGTIRRELRKAGLASPEQIADVLANSLVAVWERCQKGHNAIRNIRSFLYGVCRNKARRAMRNAIRRMKKEAQIAVELKALLEGKEKLSEEPSEELIQQARAAISRLPESHRKLLETLYVEEIEDAEAQKKSGRSPGAWRVAKHRAHVALKQEFFGSGDEVKTGVAGAEGREPIRAPEPERTARRRARVKEKAANPEL